MFRIIKKVLEKSFLGNLMWTSRFCRIFVKQIRKFGIWKQEKRQIQRLKKAVLTAGAGEGYKKQTLFIGLFMVEKWMPWLEQKLLYAKGIQDKTGIRPIVADWEYNENPKSFMLHMALVFCH